MNAYRPRERVVTYASPAGSPVVSTSDMKAHLRVDHTDEDALIGTYVAAAVAEVEKYTQRLLTVREAVLQLPGLPLLSAPVELPGGPVSSVQSVVADGVAITGAVSVGQSPALLVPASDWPVVTGTGYPVTITYTVGHSTPPADLIAAVKLICAHRYEHRSTVEAGAMSEVPMSARWIMSQHRIRPA